MAPSPVIEDYYEVLEVEQTATLEIIVKSYKRLALKLHPDRNTKQDATQAFQLLGQAYETLKDESKRRAYDLTYSSRRRTRPSPQTSQSPRPPPASTPKPEAVNEAAQIAALQKLKQERGARWYMTKNTFDSSIFELKRGIRQLEQEIKNLDSISNAEAATEAQKNSWTTWLLSPIYKKPEDTEEEKERKERGRQERRIEKDMKERRLVVKQGDLKKEENLLRKAQEDIDAAHRADDEKIRVIQARKQAREIRERQERENAERERKAKIWKEQLEQQEKREREIAEAWRKQQEMLRKQEEVRRAAEQKRQEERRAAEQKRQEEATRKRRQTFNHEARRFQEQYMHSTPPHNSTRQAHTATCRHDGWWPKIQGRTACPECHDIWTYMLQCPGCEMQACPKCQSALRPRRSRHGARTNPRVPPRIRTPSPNFDYDYWD